MANSKPVFTHKLLHKDETKQLTRYKTKRYNQVAKDFLKSKTNVEPWLHIQIITENNKKSGFETVHYAIYVWDSREVVEEGTMEITGSFNSDKLTSIFTNTTDIPNALDEHEPLNGSGPVAEEINKRWSKK